MEEAVSSCKRIRLALSLTLSFPVVPDSFLEEGERNILGAAARAPHFFHHTHGAIGIPRVDEYGRGALQIRVCRQPGSDCVAGAFIIPV